MEKQQLTFANNLKKYRKEANLTQAQLAEKLSYTGKSISKWELGTTFPPSELLPDLAKALGVDLNTLFDFREQPTLYLGIDGGGTKTHFVLCDINGKILQELILEGCNPASVGVDKACSILAQGITKVCAGYSFGSISVFAGIAGCRMETYRTPIELSLSQYRFATLVVNSDAENIISAGLNGNDGIIVIMGTGSVIYSVSKGKRHQTGGYGPFIGDDFSGSMFGSECLRAALFHRDGSGPETVITELIIEKTGVEPTELVPQIYSKGKGYMASFAPLLFEAVDKEDKVAIDILRKNVIQLSAQLSSVLNQFEDYDESIPIILAGGMTNFADVFLQMLSEKISNKTPCTIEILRTSPVIGALWLAGLNREKEIYYAEN